MDNEAPKGLRQHFIAKNIQYEFVPPFTHRANKAERAIQTFKRHFISILAGAHPSFPIDFWHELIPQAEITLNMMCAFADQRNISAYHGIHRKPYDFLSHPLLAPCGTLIVLHNSQRETWDNGYLCRVLPGQYRSTAGSTAKKLILHSGCLSCFLHNTKLDPLTERSQNPDALVVQRLTLGSVSKVELGRFL
jgi:hypothetical protein